MNPPTRGAPLTVPLSLLDFASAGRLKASPTLATGDFKISIDGGALTNLTTLPVVVPAGGKIVLVHLTGLEMDGDTIAVVCSDQTEPPEWCDQSVVFVTTE